MTVPFSNSFHHILQLTAILIFPKVFRLCTSSIMSSSDNINIKSPVRLYAVQGNEDRRNDVIYCKSAKNLEFPKSYVIFFGGDSQDYPENMKQHRDNKRYLDWNLESVAQLLSGHFVDSDIMVVKPSRMELKSFSCYDNFVSSNCFGAPTHSSDHGCLCHLQALFSNILPLIKEQNTSTTTQEDSQSCSKASQPLVLIGFSKGCVVLNQILYELHLTAVNPELRKFVSTISDMYWLDGGHSGGSNTWINDQALLKDLVATDAALIDNIHYPTMDRTARCDGIHIHVFMTPYQVKDQRRPWIRKEEKQFSDTLLHMNANIERKVLFEDEPADILMHFRVLKEFKKFSHT